MQDTSIDLRETACEAIKQYLLEKFEDIDFWDVIDNDPEASEMLQEEQDIVVENMKRVKVSVKAFL